jgi:hypothetical protein
MLTRFSHEGHGWPSFCSTSREAILLVIAYVLADQTGKVPFIHRDDMVENFAPAASNPSFRRFVLPRRLYARPFLA